MGVFCYVALCLVQGGVTFILPLSADTTEVEYDEDETEAQLEEASDQLLKRPMCHCGFGQS